MVTQQLEISVGRQLLTRSWGLVIIGPPFLRCICSYPKVSSLSNECWMWEEAFFSITTHNHLCSLREVGIIYYWWDYSKFFSTTQVYYYSPDYFTWLEYFPLKKGNESQVISFLNHHIITRFGLLISLVFYNATYFSSPRLTEFSLEKGVNI